MGEEDGHISSGMKEMQHLHQSAVSCPQGEYCEAHVRSCADQLVFVWEFKAREDGKVAFVIDGLLCTISWSQSGFVPMILYNASVSPASGDRQVAVR